MSSLNRTAANCVACTPRVRTLTMCLALMLCAASASAQLPPPERQTQLAGNSLAEYPFFEYVKAFNEDATVELAIDPTRFPGLIGLTADIYVVSAKTAGQWTSDPALTDVAGGPLTVTFGGGTIQENTFLVAGPYDLNGDAGTDLGVGYDVVLDVDRDGVLGYDDYIDGLGDEAGLYVVHDTTQPGPLAVTELSSYSVGTVFGIPSGYTNQNTFYPTAMAAMGELPLIVVSHGNGHNYQWYDHIANHLASYGYIVMSHQNNTGPGIEYCSVTTLGHTDAFLDQLDTIGGGVLLGHVDSHRIVWIGHSRGAEGITRAYDRIYDGDYTHGAVPPTNYGLEDLVLLSSMLPVDFLKTDKSNPHEANFHLWTASGDADVNGSASCDLCQTYHLHERATKYRTSTTVQGTGHGDFHSGSGGDVFIGPCHIEPRSEVHKIQNGLFLPLIMHYVDGNIPATDFFWRQYERFHPIGVDTSNPCIVVSNEYRNGADTGNFFIDHFEGGTSPSLSSSGGAVTYTVQNLTEGRLDDDDASFSWTAGDPFNGATQDSSEGADNGRGVVFDWNGADRYIEWEVIPAQRDFSDDLYLSFRGAQGTQHPYTLAVMGDLTFSATLRDGGGTTGSISIGAYGGGLEQPYDRSGGWHNEMEVIRIRLTDFLHNGSGLALTNIVAVRLDVGPSWGSNEGRIVVDELMLTNDVPPPIAGAISISLPYGAPDLIPPDVPATMTVRISASGETYVPGSGTLHYRYDGGAFQTSALVPIGGDLFEATLPAPTCTDVPEYYFSAAGTVSGVVNLPPDAPTTTFASAVGELTSLFQDNFETDQGWIAENLGATTGDWQRGVPVDDPSWDYDPALDSDGSGQCYLTQNELGNTDVDNGAVRLTSPTLDLSAPDFVLAYDYFLRLTVADGTDMLLVEMNASDGVGTWTEITRHDTDGGLSWRHFEIDRAAIVAAGVTPTATTKIRFTANDDGTQSIVEAGLDAFEVFVIQCEAGWADCNDNGIPDDQDIADCDGSAWCSDCNANGVPDECDIAGGTSQDCDANGVPDECQPDGDGDGTIDPCDGCPSDPDKTEPGTCGCGVPDTDSDGDGTPDCVDGCPSDPDKAEPGVCGCGVPDVDSDGDGVLDCNDGCPDDPDKTEPGVCGCGTPDIDSDGDGVLDCNDGCPDDPDKTEPGVCGCGVPDVDSDGDGFLDCADNCPATYNPGQEDCDGDGVGDACAGEPDCNGNGIPDSCDIAAGVSEDCNTNGVPDECDIAAGTSEDGNGNGIPDECETGTLVDDVATSDVAVKGTVSGSYVDTWADDGVSESITERESGGKPSKRFSYLEHIWTFDVVGGSAVTFYLNGYRTASTDGDDFVLAYSTDATAYVEMFTLFNTSDDGSYESYSLPSATQGTVYIRVADTDRTPSHLELDTVYIDHMFIRSETMPGTPPAAPSDLTAVAISPYEIDLTWVDNADDEYGFELERSLDGLDWTLIDTVGVDVTAYTDAGLSPSTAYFHRVRAYNASGSSAYADPASATTQEGPSIFLTALGTTLGIKQVVNLEWTGATTANVDIYRDGELIATTPNDGSYRDSLGKDVVGTFVYEVCEEGAAECSNPVTVSF